MVKRRAGWLFVLAALALLASACGARVSEQQLRATGISRSSGEAVGGPAGAGDVGVSSSTGAPGSASPGGTTPTQATASAGGTPTTAAPAGGNGGATDVGVTPNQITLGNVSTLSGPVPGLFQGAVLGTQAVIAYQNSQGGLFGRKFKLDARDDQFDTGQNRAQTSDLLNKVFAFVGSFSLYDDAAVGEIGKTNIPDLSVYLNPSRGALKNNFATAPSDIRGAPTGPFLYFKGKFPDAVTKMGTIYGDVPASKNSHLRFKATAESVGWHYVYERGFQATETDFTADVVRMKSSGVKGIYLVSTDDKTTARFAKAMAQQGFKPDFFVANYMPTLPALAGPAVENVYSASPFGLFAGEDNAVNPETRLFNEWFQKVRPGGKPDLFAVYGWAQGRLLFQALQAAGPKATRADVSRELAKITTFSSGGIIGDAGPGPKRPSICYVIAQIKQGRYARVDPAKGYRCDGAYFRR
jgi:ABC-type branched-subunit amino acid transport system substrate-binding protein